MRRRVFPIVLATTVFAWLRAGGMLASLLAIVLVALLATFAPWPPAIAGAAEDHAGQVRSALKAGYVRNPSSQCSPVDSDILGWPKAAVEKCSYRGGALSGLAYLLIIKPERIAAWIETACATHLAGTSGCFKTLLSCARSNSGMMFAISGNVMEDMDGAPWTNYLFRNGMTVALPGAKNGSTTQIPMEQQAQLALAPDSSIARIPSGVTRLWRTLPHQYAAAFPGDGAPTTLATPQARQAWLDIAKGQTLAALEANRNRLLEAYVAAHPKTLARGRCPADDAP